MLLLFDLNGFHNVRQILDTPFYFTYLFMNFPRYEFFGAFKYIHTSDERLALLCGFKDFLVSFWLIPYCLRAIAGMVLVRNSTRSSFVTTLVMPVSTPSCIPLT